MPEPNEREVVERVRRIETRITKIGNHLGVDVGGGKPVWRDGTIVVPSPNCSIGDIVKVIPMNWPPHEGVDVLVGSDYLATLYIDP